MKTPMFLFAAALASLSAAPASAQERPNHRVPIQRGIGALDVHDFQPRTGSVGSLVTVHGQGFTPAATLRIGGAPVPVHQVSPTSITFRVPPRHGDGFITVQYSEAARAIPVGAFTVVEHPAIDWFSPGSGTPGTRVELRGHGFRPGDRVTLNGQSLPIRTLTPTRIVVTIPDYATSGYLMLDRTNGMVERTSRPFTVLAHQLHIASVTPTIASPGQLVYIHGHDFRRGDQVTLNGMHLRIVELRSNRITVRVPVGVHGGSLVVTRGPYQAAAPHILQVPNPSRIDRVMPGSSFAITRIARERVQPGSSVVLHGRNLHAGIRVLWGQHELPVTRVDRRGNSLTVTVPAYLSGTYPVYLEHGSLRLQSPRMLEVMPPHGWPGQVEVRDHRKYR